MPSPGQRTLLPELPEEVSQVILRAFSDPLDLVRLAQTCRTFQASIDDELLWRYHYLRHYDRPFERPASWQATMRTRLRARHALDSSEAENIQRNSRQIIETLLDIAATSAPLDVDEMAEGVPPKNSLFLASLFANESSTASQALLSTVPPRLTRSRQASIHVKATQLRMLEGRCRLPDYLTTAKERVYSLPYYTANNQWGPFEERTGLVDWPQLEAVVHVMRTNIEENFDDWAALEVEGNAVPGVPVGFAAMLPWPARPLCDSTEGDWAGVERWPLVGTYAFLDFREFHYWNTSAESATLEGSDQGCGDIMALRLKLVDGPPSAAVDSTYLPSSPKRKILYFRGSSSSLVAMGDSAVTGAVFETPDGQIRWRMMISYAGADRWALEGVQLGSSGAIAGVWSDASRELFGPVGPFMYWRGLSDAF